MSNPRIKRPFAGAASDPAQRQITSFFNVDADEAKKQTQPAHTVSRGSSPTLPPSVQASLLAVGMRVRKSVPEGYKTGKDDGQQLRRPQQQQLRQQPPILATTSHTHRELLPFCALHQVGGLGVQTFSDSHGQHNDRDDDEPPSLTSSQQTVSSTSSWDDPSTRKRRQDEDDEDDEDDDDECIDVSAMPPPAAFYQRGRRVLAVPRRRQAHTLPQLSSATAMAPQKTASWHDQENGGSGMVMGDFDEADFLDASTWAERDQEMGGV